jgi:hypothetical protein
VEKQCLSIFSTLDLQWLSPVLGRVKLRSSSVS